MSSGLTANSEVTLAVHPPVVTNGRRPFTKTVVQADLHRDTRRPTPCGTRAFGVQVVEEVAAHRSACGTYCWPLWHRFGLSVVWRTGPTRPGARSGAPASGRTGPPTILGRAGGAARPRGR